jgi:hypothetical protein
MAGMLTASFTLSTSHYLWLPDLEDKAAPSTNGAGPSHRVRVKAVETILCGTDVSQGKHIRTADESVQRPRSVTSQVRSRLTRFIK